MKTLEQQANEATAALDNQGHEWASLDELYEAIISGGVEMSASLPTFGGETPSSTAEVWSWDEGRLMVGTCTRDLEIVDRVDW